MTWPPFVTWAEGLSTKTVGEDLFFGLHPNFGPKTGLNFEWRPFFFFWSSPNIGQENWLGFELKNFHSGLHYSQIFWISCPPPLLLTCVYISSESVAFLRKLNANRSWIYFTEVESSRTHFEVLGLDLGLEGQVLGLKASSPRKLPCPRLEDSTIFWTVEISLENARNLAENLRAPFLFFSLGA